MRDYITARLQKELRMIAKLNLEHVFMEAARWVKEARKKGFVVGPGFDVMPSSFLAYYYEITAIDPLEYGLHFECFACREQPVITLVLSSKGSIWLKSQIVEKKLPVEIKSFSLLDYLESREGWDQNWNSLKKGEPWKYLAESKVLEVLEPEYSNEFREFILEARPTSLIELATVIALFRPAPVELGLADQYIEAPKGKTRPLLPEIVHILKETRGVLIFREQYMDIAHLVTGYSLEEAYWFARILGRKFREEIEFQREKFVRSAIRKGLSSRRAKELFNFLEKSAGSMYSKSHALALATMLCKALSFLN
ncbi:hypothetical protein [Thermosulfurimonas sp. F29]|uniref:hypothetical protein n=1 Tax=Thermosulfurimonas sp. F29 TaxID=2867247 RepID=UPI001C83E6D5|nr:hypothetical protein [Thermosulfurimonas sp. F29]MBX6422655.1 hypothetical protein [Thermosulfurimonas sp. F29]